MTTIAALLWLAAGAWAQGPGSAEPFTARAEEKKEESEIRRMSPTASPVAIALEKALGESVWERVQISTAGPVADLSKLSREGFYKLELIQMVLMSAKAKKPLREAAEKRRKGVRLREIAAGYRVDYDELYEEALAVEELLDEEYLPAIHKRKTRRRVFQ